ncbi:MAG: efflux RND transporter permease subunit [Chitinivibrionia bacterium]|nr:efflux RND transporter permease subunit [Chitinivibrionia bacterium]
MNIGKFSVNNSVFLNILMVTMLTLGTIVMFQMPKEAMSDVTYSWGMVMVYYPGVSASDVEKSVTAKIENEIADIKKLKKIISIAQDGFTYILIEFDDGISDAEFRIRFSDLQKKVSNIKLPEGIVEPLVLEASLSEFMPVIQLNITGDSTVLQEDINAVARAIKDDFLSIRDVSKVEIVGGRDREVEIAVNRERAEAMGINVAEIISAIQNKHISIPAGVLKTLGENYYVRTQGEVFDRRDFGDIIVRQRGGSNVKVRDVATISDGLAKSNYDMRYNGGNVVALPISKSAQGNSIDVIKEVKEKIKGYEQRNKNLKFFWSGDTTIQIRDTLKTLSNNAIGGMILLFLIMLLFLGWRNALISTIEIPLTFAAVFVVMKLYGETLNGNSMFALVLVLGLIVDHSIVIMENMYRYLQKGKDKITAAIDGTNEVAIPVISATLTTIAVFLPLILLPGMMGKFMRPIPLLISVALLISTIFAMIFIPMHFAEMGNKTTKEQEWFVKFREFFRKIAIVCYRHKIKTLLFTLFFIIIIPLIAASHIKAELFGGEFQSQFSIDIELVRGSSREKTNKVVEEFEKKISPLIGNGEITGISTSVGYMVTDKEWLTRDNIAQINILLAEKSEGRTRNIPEIIKDIEKLCKGIAGAEKVVFRSIATGLPVEKPVFIRLLGDNLAEMADLSDNIQRKLSSYKNLYNISDDFERTSPELIVKINEYAAAQYGLSVAQIGNFLRIGIDGVKVATWFDENAEVDVVVRFDDASKSSIEQIQTLKIPTPHGTFVPFSAVAELVANNGISKINRSDRKRAIEISADTYDKVEAARVNKEILEWFENSMAKNYPTTKISLEGEFTQFNNLLKDIIPLFCFGLFLLYLILGSQFKSYLQPFLMIFSIPLAAIGVILFLAVSGTPVSIIVMYAFIALAGIATNDSIVLISYINRLRRFDGLRTTEAVIEGVVTRLRPIILTTVSTMGGLAPLSLGLGGKSDMWAPMASTIIFGLIFSTLGTLFIIPCVYGVMDDVSKKFNRKMRLEGE